MECNDAEIYLVDYQQNRLGCWAKLKLKRHLKQCARCREQLNRFQNVVTLLEYDFVPEPPPGTWQNLSQGILQSLESMYAARPSKRSGIAAYPKIALWRYVAASLVLVFFSLGAWLILPSYKNTNDHSPTLFWTFWNSDFWDFSQFSQKLDNQKLQQMTPRIAKAVHVRLEKELELDNKDSSRLFSLLQNFGNKMKECYVNYGNVKGSLTKAMEMGENSNLESYLDEFQLIRQRWFESRWQFLSEVKFILNQQKFARFLLFTERLPRELYLICAQTCPN